MTTPTDDNNLHPIMQAALAPFMPRRADPLAALLDAQVDAHHAGVSDAEIEVLHGLGRSFAAVALEAARQLNATSDARMVTRWTDGIERRAAERVEAATLLTAILEAAFGDLDAYPVIQTAAAVELGKGAK